MKCIANFLGLSTKNEMHCKSPYIFYKKMKCIANFHRLISSPKSVEKKRKGAKP